jgi:hypothetical protein
MPNDEQQHDSSSVATTGAAAQAEQHPVIPDDLFCPQCGYNLRGLVSDRCPECGYSIDTVRSMTSGIPWVLRKDLGRFRAYWKTVSLVMFRHRRFCDEIVRHVSYADSQSFRWVTVGHAYLPVLLATMALYALAPSEPFRDEVFDWLWASVWPVAVLHLCILLFLAAITGVPSYFFHPNGVPVYWQNRAIAMSYYASGPLALTFVPVLAVVGAYGFWAIDYLASLFVLAGLLFPVVQAVAWWLDLIHISRRVVSQRPRWPIVVGVCVPVLWLILAGLIFVTLPFSAFLILVAIKSLG